MPGPAPVSTVRAVTATPADLSTTGEHWWQATAPVAWLRAHPRAADALLLSPILAMAFLGAYIDRPHTTAPIIERPYDLLGLVLLLTVMVPVIWRRRAPRLVLAVSVAATVPLLALGYSDHGAAFATLLALYTVAAHCERRPALIALGWTCAIMVPLLVAGIFYEGEQLPLSVFIANIVILATAWLIGDTIRNRRQLVEVLRLRAETAERQRDEEARRAVLAERARIAREMHDIVAHGMSVMIVQAGGARRILAKHPDQATEALASIERTGREAMAEMRRLLGVLRDDEAITAPGAANANAVIDLGSGPPAPLAPQPGLTSVPHLVEQWNDAGLPVTCRIGASPEEVPGSVDVSAYRLIQEALTNVSKHAGPATATVQVAIEGDRLDIRVDDDGRGAAAAGAEQGHGLLGMQERVAVFDGTVTAGPRPGGGWSVHASLPLPAGAPPAGSRSSGSAVDHTPA
jgi:signal transduction histidine kinase